MNTSKQLYGISHKQSQIEKRTRLDQDSKIIETDETASKGSLTLGADLRPQVERVVIIIIRMGQCSLTDQEGGCDVFTSKSSDEGSYLAKESCTEKDRLMWENELNMGCNSTVPDSKYWAQPLTVSHPCFNQITKDVTRTFPELPYFGSKSNIQRFEKILRKVALYFPHVGYTQGLNFSAGFLMISGCDDQECFRLLTKIMVNDRILAIGLYEDNFPLVTLYCEVFWILLEKKMPNVYGMLKKNYITDDLWLFQWFISLFLYNFPIEFAKKVWDFIICKKEMAVVLIALGIIKSIKKELIEFEFQDQIQFLDFVNQFKRIDFCRDYLDIKKIFSYANSITKSEIEKALSQTKCLDNPYRIYFSSSTSQQKEQWQTLINRLEAARVSFAINPKPIKFQRADVFENVQKLILTKYKLYQSELKKSNVYKKSNLSIPFSIKTTKSTNPVGFSPRDLDFNKKQKQ